MRTWLVASVLSFKFLNCAAADDRLDNQGKALDVIATFSEKICKSVPLEGDEQNVVLSASAKAQLSGAIKKIAALDIGGVAKYLGNKYEGLLREQLLSALKDNTNCRLQVFKDLKDKLIDASEAPSPRSYLRMVGKWVLRTSGHYEVIWRANFYLNGDEMEATAGKVKVNERDAFEAERNTVLRINGRFDGLEFRGDSEEKNHRNQVIRKRVYFKFAEDLRSFIGGLTTDGNEAVFNIKGEQLH